MLNIFIYLLLSPSFAMYYPDDSCDHREMSARHEAPKEIEGICINRPLAEYKGSTLIIGSGYSKKYLMRKGVTRKNYDKKVSELKNQAYRIDLNNNQLKLVG